MKVILTQDVPGTGKKNEVVTVSDGFARNYLFPRKWAREATPAAIREIERRNEAERAQEMERVAAAEQLASELRDKVILLRAKCGDKGRLYGSITGQEIADALKGQHHTEIDRRKIELADPIRTVGEYTVTVTVYAGIKVPMKVQVVPLTQE